MSECPACGADLSVLGALGMSVPMIEAHVVESEGGLLALIIDKPGLDFVTPRCIVCGESIETKMIDGVIWPNSEVS